MELFFAYFSSIMINLKVDGLATLIWKGLPLFFIMEVPFTLLVTLGAIRFSVRRKAKRKMDNLWHPKVSIVITCYSEGSAVLITLNSLFHQEYKGVIEVIPVVDGSVQNSETYKAVLSGEKLYGLDKKRELVIVDKQLRGGRVSTLNAGLFKSTGEIVINLDGDTSVDNDMVEKIVRNFLDKEVVAVSGNIRVRNYKKSIVTQLQSVEYLLGISMGRLGLSEFGVINNISGAFGAFRAPFLKKLGGWDTGTAEDLSLTTRIKGFLRMYPTKKILFEPDAIAHTDAPETVKELFHQRERWDGDLVYVYFRKYWRSISPQVLGWKNFFLYIVLGIFFQILLPFILVAYHVYLLVNFPLGTFFAILTFVYILYLFFLSIQFGVYLVFVSRDKLKDLSRVLWLPLIPAYALTLRLLISLFIIKELFLKTHLDSSMAPWWVLKKEKY
jgi:biofilm PGA synthesis N-glycosyltransferase PgaC